MRLNRVFAGQLARGRPAGRAGPRESDFDHIVKMSDLMNSNLRLQQKTKYNSLNHLKSRIQSICQNLCDLCHLRILPDSKFYQPVTSHPKTLCLPNAYIQKIKNQHKTIFINPRKYHYNHPKTHLLTYFFNRNHQSLFYYRRLSIPNLQAPSPLYVHDLLILPLQPFYRDNQ